VPPEPPDDHAIAVHLDKLLADRGMTLTELSERVGVSVVNLLTHNGADGQAGPPAPEAEPAVRAGLTHLEEVTMYQPHPSAGQPAGPARPPAPAPVRTAVKLMYAGAAISALPVLAALAYVGDIRAYRLHWGSRSLTAVQISHWRPLIIAVVILVGLLVPALWLWLARAVAWGGNWARIVSTVLFGLATLFLSGRQDVVQEVAAVLAWLAGAAVVWLLWRPAASAFFTPAAFVRVPPATPRMPGRQPPRPV
jgi:hypothetical protein